MYEAIVIFTELYNQPIEFESFEFILTFRLGGGGRTGGDGLAVWLVEEPGTLGPVFGARDNWNGIGIFIDSYDNDGLVS
jgi:hypothetical protein